MKMEEKSVLLFQIIATLLGCCSNVLANYCPPGQHPYTIDLSCVQFSTRQPLNYSTALTEAQNNTDTDLAIVRGRIDRATLTAYAKSFIAQYNNEPLWISCYDCYEEDCDEMEQSCLCPALSNRSIDLLDCTLELGYVIQISYIQNVSALYQEPLYINADESFVLEVPSPYNDSDYSIVWRFNDDKLNLSVVSGGIQTDNSIRLENLTNDLFGIYKAFLNNGFSQVLVYTIDLRKAVFEPPQPASITIPKGQLAVFECTSPNSQPTPDIVWFDSNGPIVSEGKYFVSRSGSLYIRDVSTNEAGEYSCTTNNTVGSATASAQLEVVNTTVDENSLFVRFIQIPKNQTILEEEIANFECAVTSNHIIDPNQLNIVTNYIFEAGDTFLDTLLYRPSVQAYPSLLYSPEVPTAIRCQVQVTVSTPPPGAFASVVSEYVTITPNAKAVITSVSNSTSAPLGQPVSLTCSYTGTPAPQVQWYLNGDPYNNSESTSDISTVYIDQLHLKDVGTYQCFIMNAHSIAAQSITLSAKDGIPGPVSFTAMLVSGDSNAMVTWTPLVNTNTLSPVLIRYSVVWRIAGETDTKESLILPHMASNLSLNLKKGVTYEIGVLALSLTGKGPVEYEQITIPKPYTDGSSLSSSTTSVTTTRSHSTFVTRSSQHSTSETFAPTNQGIVPGKSIRTSLPIAILIVIVCIALIVIVAIVICFIGQYVWWRDRRRGNYSPSKVEENYQRKLMFSVEPTPITPPASATSSTGPFFHSFASSISSETQSELSVEVIRINSSMDDLCEKKH